MELFPEKYIRKISNSMLAKRQSVATAESVTSGLLQLAFGNMTDASKFFQGGMTVYNIAQKYHHLGIEPIHALSCNCVSEQVAQQMALGAANAFKSSWGIAVTGYASKVPESNNQLFAFYAIAFENTVAISNRIRYTDDDTSLQAQLYYVNTILKQFCKLL